MKIFLDGFKAGFSEFSWTLAILINSVLLTFVYFFGIGGVALFSKLLKKSFLETKITKKSKTYWSGHTLGKKPIEDYYRLF